MLLNKFFKLRINSGDTADFWDLVSAWLQRTELREFFPQFFSDGCHDNSNSTSFWYKTLLYYSLPLLFRVIRISASSIFENTSKKKRNRTKVWLFLTSYMRSKNKFTWIIANNFNRFETACWVASNVRESFWVFYVEISSFKHSKSHMTRSLTPSSLTICFYEQSMRLRGRFFQFYQIN